MTVVVPALEKVLLQEMDALKRGKGGKKTGAEQERTTLKGSNQSSTIKKKKYMFMILKCLFYDELLVSWMY